MKRSFLVISLLLLLSNVASVAQTPTPQFDNSKRNLVLGNVKFAAATSVGSALVGVLINEVSVQDKSYMPAMQAAILRALASARRTVFKEIPAAQLKDEMAAAGDNTPAYEVSFTVSSLGSRFELKKDAKYYTGFAAVTLSMKDLKTNEVWASQKFSEQYTSYGTYTAEDAVNNAISYVAYDITRFLNNTFPVTGSIIEPGGVKKDKQKEVYVDIAKNWGIPKGETMAVYTSKTIAGRDARTKISTIKVEEVMGDDVARCKVTKGGDKLKEALDNGEKVVVVCY